MVTKDGEVWLRLLGRVSRRRITDYDEPMVPEVIIINLVEEGPYPVAKIPAAVIAQADIPLPTMTVAVIPRGGNLQVRSCTIA